MLFIGGIGDLRSTEQKLHTGIVSAYDFMKDAVIIKTYDSGSLEHPLARSWFKKDTEEGLFVSQKPKEFAKALVVSKSDGLFPGFERPDAGDLGRWFNCIAASLVGGWLSKHGKALGVPDTKLARLAFRLAHFKID